MIRMPKTMGDIPMGIILACLVFSFDYAWVSQGFDVTDTGFHLANQMLAVSKDIYPEVAGPTFLTDYIGGIWLSLSQKPSLLWAKTGSCLLAGLNSLLIFLIIIRYHNRYKAFIAVLSTSVFIGSIDGYHLIHYYSFPALLTNLALYAFTMTLCLEVGSKGFKTAGFLSGFLYVPIVLGRLPLFLMILSPVSLIVYMTVTKTSRDRLWKTLRYGFIGLVASIIFFTLLYWHMGILEAYFHNVRVLLLPGKGSGLYVQRPEVLFSAYADNVEYALYYALQMLLGLAVVSFVRRHLKVGQKTVSLCFIACLVLYTIHRGYPFILPEMRMVAGSLLAFSILYLAKDPTAGKEASQLILLSSMAMMITPIASTEWRNISFGMWLILPMAILSLEHLKHMFRTKSVRDALTVDPRVLCLAFVLLATYNSYNYVYRDCPRPLLNTEFRHGYLRGIYSSPERVRVVEELLSELDKRTSRDDETLMATGLPMFYYLTETRPAFGQTWLVMDTLSDIKGKFEDSIAQDRLPRVFVCSKWSTRYQDWELTKARKDDFYENATLDYLQKKFTKQLGYRKAWENEVFIVYERP